MPIPQVKKQQMFSGAIALCRTEAVLDEGLFAVREGVLAMLALGEEKPDAAGAQIAFRQLQRPCAGSISHPRR